MRSRPGCRTLDERASDTLPGIVGVHAHLLDVGGPIDDVEYDVADGPVLGVDRYEGPTTVSVRCQLLDGAGIVIGHHVHPERSEGLTCSPLYLHQDG